jgi:hypothetical protein
MSTVRQTNPGGLWANMTDVQKMAHSIKTGSDWQNRASNAGLRDQATEYLQYDNTPGIQGDNMDNGYYGWSPSHDFTSPMRFPTVGNAGPTNNTPPPPPPSRTSNASNTAGMMGAVTNAIRGMNGTQTPAQLQQTRNEQTQSPTQLDMDDIKGPAIAVCMGAGMSPGEATKLVNTVGPEAATQMAGQQQPQLGFGHQSQGLGLSDTSYTQPYGGPAPINQPSAAPPPGHGGGNPGYSGMLSNPAETLAALKALTDRLRSRGG